MSVALVVLRFEIPDDIKAQFSFSYLAPEYVDREKTKDKLSYASVTSFTKNKQPKSTSDEIVLYRGQRELSRITIETYINSEKSYPVKMTDEHRKSLPVDITTMQTDHPVLKDDTILLSDHVHGKSRESSVTSDISSGSSARSLPKEVTFQPIMALDSQCSARPGSGVSRPKSHSPPSRASPTIHFFSGNPTVEVTKGILHIYKDNQMTSLGEGVNRSELICMLGVPAAYNLRDLLDFTAPINEGIEYMKIIRDATPNQYMVLVKFKTQTFADDFFSTYNNTPYNSIEPDICHLVYVAKVETLKESEGACMPVPGLTELPNCPVCLERMDEAVDGILTILCSHAFHMSCLSQWGDTSCPVCRYCQTPEEVADNKCMKCGSQESLWICLICGNIGCGRYVGMHAYRHFQDSQHTYAMQIGNNRVWDYAGDNYVHRLVQNKADGKLVQVDERGNVVQEEKLDSLTLEYTYLLTSQLESQRLFFEEKMAHIEQEAQTRVSEMETRHQVSMEESKKLQESLSRITKEKQSAERKCSHLHTKYSKVLTDLQEEKQMNGCLRQNQEGWQNRVELLEEQVKNITEIKDKEMKDLQEQLRDVMFYLEAQQKLANTDEVSQEEIQESQVILGAAANPPTNSKKTRKKNR
ncbi:hypothetical protein ScPMuIL_006550 [Solemya velum]